MKNTRKRLIVAGMFIGILAYVAATNTSRSVPRSIPKITLEHVKVLPIEDLSKPHKQLIEEYSESVWEEYNLPPGLITIMLRYESKTGELMRSKSGCLGWLQFCKRTAKSYNVTNPMDLDQSLHGGARLMLDNMNHLRQYNVEVTPFNLYLSHMIGSYSVKTLAKLFANKSVTSKESRVLRKVMRSNWTSSMGRFRGTDLQLASNFTDTIIKNYKKLNRKMLTY